MWPRRNGWRTVRNVTVSGCSGVNSGGNPRRSGMWQKKHLWSKRGSKRGWSLPIFRFMIEPPLLQRTATRKDDADGGPPQIRSPGTATVGSLRCVWKQNFFAWEMRNDKSLQVLRDSATGRLPGASRMKTLHSDIRNISRRPKIAAAVLETARAVLKK